LTLTKLVQAVFENGVLRPIEPLNLTEKELVTVSVANGQANNGPIPDSAPLSDDEFERLLDELASESTQLPLPPDFSRADIYADHD
jgi:predicted DNA-binding antitoxin AbrB/MazE fold protein